MAARSVVGIQPWLPWPLSAWRWWTEPVAAQRLAALRIGLASILLLDVVLTYNANITWLFGPDSLGTPDMFDYLGRAPRWYWSIFRGVHDPLLGTFALLGCLVTTGWLLLGLYARLTQRVQEGDPPTLRWALLAWLPCTAFLVLAFLARTEPPTGERLVPWLGGLAHWQWGLPLLAFWVGLGFWALAFLRRFQGGRTRDDPWIARLTFLYLFFLLGLVWLGVEKAQITSASQPVPEYLRWLKMRGHAEPMVLQAGMWLWIAAIVGLLLGLGTRVCAVLCWTLSWSFASINFWIDNAGDQVRGLVLFYLMVSPCGAAWSLDSAIRRLRGKVAGEIFIHPWPLRLLFIQMALIYFCNGIWKVGGDEWAEGKSLFLVLGDVTLARYSYASFPLPYWVTRMMTWTVLIWELGFPLWVAVRWTRIPALLLGVLFHLGIFATMEIGTFVPYMLTLYLPLLPWERLGGLFKKPRPPVPDEVDVLPILCAEES